MKTEDLLPYSWQSATGPYSEAHESRSHPSTLFL